jgi:peptidoglycan biosynthesis protein MviN/MurJ (putative lipid II flippase)
MGHQKTPVKSLIVGCVIKIALDVVLILIKPLNILGAVISGGVCYFVVFMFNYKKIKQLVAVKFADTFFYVSIQACLVSLFAFVSNNFFKMLFGDTVSLFISGIIAVIVFAVTYYVFFMQSEKQVNLETKAELT